MKKSIGIVDGPGYTGSMEGVFDDAGMIDVDTFEDDEFGNSTYSFDGMRSVASIRINLYIRIYILTVFRISYLFTFK